MNLILHSRTLNLVHEFDLDFYLNSRVSSLFLNLVILILICGFDELDKLDLECTWVQGSLNWILTYTWSHGSLLLFLNLVILILICGFNELDKLDLTCTWIHGPLSLFLNLESRGFELVHRAWSWLVFEFKGFWACYWI